MSAIAFLLRYPRELAIVGLLAAALGTGWGWMRSHDQLVVEAERARVASLAVDEAAELADAAEAIRLQQDSINDALLAEIAREKEAAAYNDSIAGVRQREANARVVTATTALRATLDSTQAVALDSIVRYHDEESAAYEDQLRERNRLVAATQFELAIERTKYASLFSSFQAVSNEATAAQAALDARILASRPAWHDRTVAKMIFAGGLLVLGNQLPPLF